jgi:hypothetical protein
MVSNNMGPDVRRKAAAFHERNPRYAALGNSDAHELAVVGCCYTEFDAEVRSASDLVAAILAQKCRPRCRPV